MSIMSWKSLQSILVVSIPIRMLELSYFLLVKKTILYHCDEMGLGKTFQSIKILDLLHSKFKMPSPFLVFAPLSTIPHWPEREFKG